MNELQVRGWIYYETEKNTALEAYEELCNKLEKTGINADNMGFDIILRNENFEDIDTLRDRL